MNGVKRIGWFLLGVVLAAVPLLAWSAGIVQYDQMYNSLTPSGQMALQSYESAGGRVQGRTYAGGAGPEVQVRTVMREVVTSGRVPVTIDNEIRQKVLAKGIGKLAVGAMRGTVQGVVIGTAIDAAFDAAGIECDLSGCRVALVGENCPGGVCTIAATAGPGTVVPSVHVWRFNGMGAANRATFSEARNDCIVNHGANWCNLHSVSNMGWGYRHNFCFPDGCHGSYYGVDETITCPAGSVKTAPSGTGVSATCVVNNAYSCPAGQGWTLSGSQCTRPQCAAGLNRNPANGQCVTPAAKTDDEAATLTGPYFSPADAEALVREVDQAGQAAQIEAEPQEVTGPASASSPETTTQQTTGAAPNQTITNVTNQTIVNNTYNQSTWNYNVVNKTTTKDAAGNVTDTKEEDVDEAVAVTDAAMPDVPKLYDRKYPDGMQGVWNTQKANLTDRKSVV